MEDHTISEHRAWIEQTLGVFRQAGFTRYCAETIAEPGAALKERGYPTTLTGFYTLDPHFGNLLRTAIRLDFQIAHDQVLLRPGETAFELWVPDNDCEVRVADLNGRVATDVDSALNGLRVRLRSRTATNEIQK